MMERKGVAHGGAPVMTDHRAFEEAQLLDQGFHVVRRNPDAIVSQLCWPRGQIYSAEIDRHHGMIYGKFLELMPECVPVLGKSVDKQHKRSRTGYYVMQARSTHVSIVVPKLGRVRCTHFMILNYPGKSAAFAMSDSTTLIWTPSPAKRPDFHATGHSGPGDIGHKGDSLRLSRLPRPQRRRGGARSGRARSSGARSDSQAFHNL